MNLTAAGRAGLLLHWYPRGWRARYGAEFTELLIAEICEQPRSWRRVADVARAGLLARLADCGLTAHPVDPAAAARAGLATLACSAAAFLAVGTAMSAQLATGMQWSVPGSRAVPVAVSLMSGALLAFALLAVLAAAPVAGAAVAACRGRRGRGLRAPLLMIVTGALILIVGGRHFGNGWPGTGGTWWAVHGLVPSGVVAFGWATTMSITSYWAHPAMLAAFPVTELAWMALSPAAGACLVTGVAAVVRRAELPASAIRYETWLAGLAGIAMAVFLAGAACWIAAAAPPHEPFRPGIIDVAGLAGLMVALGTAVQAVRRTRLAVVAAGSR